MLGNRLDIDIRIKRLVKVVQCSEYVNTPCWLWQGNLNSKGYPRLNVRVNGKHVTLYVHRLSYELWKEAISEGYEVDHVCFTTMCINPDHLRLLENVDNSRRRRSNAKRRST